MARKIVLMFLESVRRGSNKRIDAYSEAVERNAAHIVSKYYKVVQCGHRRNENLARQLNYVQSHERTELYEKAIGERIFSSRRIHIKSCSKSVLVSRWVR